jgi:general secretion pathway protein F
MAVFEYKGLDGKGKAVKGLIDAEGPKSARTRLRKDGVFPTEVFEKSAGKATRGKGLSMEVDVASYFQRIKPQDIAEMTTQLSTLLAASVPMIESLSAVIDQCEKEKLKVVLTDLREKVNQGITLAEAMGAHPKVFSNLYINMVRAGEASGSLEVVFQRLSEYTEKQVRMRSQISSAMIYPIMMTVVGGLIVVGLFVFVIPKIRRILESMGKSLPFVTRLVLGISDFFLAWWWLVFILAGVASWWFKKWKATPDGRYKYHSILLRVPIFGPIVRQVAVARFCRTLSTLLDSGVPILTAIGIVEKVVDNEVLAKTIREAASNISEGESISGPLRESGEFPPLVTHMIAIGERTGELEPMLARVADSYDQQLENTLQGLTSLLEPLLILFMGGIVALIAVAILLPMLDMSSLQ